MFVNRRTLLKAAAGALAYKSVDFEVKETGDSGTFAGYGSVFGNVDSGGDIVEPGAFADSLKERSQKGRKLPILWQHKWAEPIGTYSKVVEDSKGLYVEGQLLVADVQRAKEAHALLKAGAVSGLSIGYRIAEGGMKVEKNGVARLSKLHLEETSLVTFPMNDEARVEAVKAQQLERIIKSGRLPSLPEFEDFLCEAGFSKSQAKAIAGGGLSKLLSRCEAEGDGAGEVVELLKNFRLPTIP